MRLAVSNIAWTAEDEERVLRGLSAVGVQGIEVAPTRLAASWEELKPAHARAYRALVEAHGMSIPAAQAILFDRPEAKLLGDAASYEKLCMHMEFVADVLVELGAHVAVFGAPACRDRGSLSTDEALRLGAERVRPIAQSWHERGLVLGVETIPAEYGCNFLCSADEGAAFVTEVDHPGLRLHLDTGCMYLAGDDGAAMVLRHGSLLGHFHFAEPRLGDFDRPVVPHAAALRSLEAIGYPLWTSIEMRATQQAEDTVMTAVRYIRSMCCRTPSVLSP